MMKVVRMVGVVVVAVGVAGCGASGGGSSASGGGTTMAAAGGAGGAQAAAGALASQLGIPENYVSTALNAAQGALGTGPKTADTKAAAAQTGVDKAAAQAQSDGKPLTEPQKSGLLDGLKNLL